MAIQKVFQTFSISSNLDPNFQHAMEKEGMDNGNGSSSSAGSGTHPSPFNNKNLKGYGVDEVALDRDLGRIITAINRILDTGIFFVQTATGTVANTVAETAITSTGVGSLTLPANFLTVGKVINVYGSGIHSSTASPTLRLKVKLGSTVILDTTAISSKNGTNDGFNFYGNIICRSVGSSGTIFSQGIYNEYQNPAIDIAMTNTVAITIDTTASQTLSATATWGTASASNAISMTNFTAECN